MSHNGHKVNLKEVLKATGAKDWNEAVVRLAYADLFGLPENQILNFNIRLSRPADVRRIISLIESYNKFEGEPIAEALATLMEQGTVMYVEFGREGSPVLHIFMNKPNDNRAAMMDLFRKFGADELDEFGPWAIRAWWD
jgi:hypothetical protein